MYRLGTIRRWMLSKIEAEFPRIMSFGDMFDALCRGASLARFGDGEFIVARGGDLSFQSATPALQRRLRDVLLIPTNDKLIVAIPPYHDALHSTVYDAKIGLPFMEYFYLFHWHRLRKWLTNPLYGNAFFSRISVFHEIPVERLVKLWQGRDVVFVVPQNGHFAYDERLFGGIGSRSEITVPSTQAFSDYDRILAECLTHSREKLFFIAAGPMATVLAADLSGHGYQALDMGHFPNCYWQYLGEAKAPEHYPYTKE